MGRTLAGIIIVAFFVALGFFSLAVAWFFDVEMYGSLALGFFLTAAVLALVTYADWRKR